MEKVRNITVIGLGLLGGSVCKAMKALDPEVRISAYGRNPDKFSRAVRDRSVDSVGLLTEMNLATSDLVIVSTPVIASMEIIGGILDRPDLGEDVLVIDVGSVKRSVVQEALGHERASRFIGCHPMAGSEKTGYEHSSESLYQNASVIITPHSMNAPDDVGRVRSFWESLGAAVTVTTAEVHDLYVAYTSHLPHVAAGSLVAVLYEFLSGPGKSRELEPFIGNGFRDTTRIAAGSPDMWRDILLSNRDNIGKVLDEMIGNLREIRRILGDGESLYRHLSEIKRHRDGVR